MYNTPLISALNSHAIPAVLELLLYFGADPEAKSRAGHTTLSLAQEYNRAQILDFEILDLLLSYAKLLEHIKAHPSKELLCNSIEKGYFTLVRVLLQRGITVTLSDLELAKECYRKKQDIRYEIIGRLIRKRLSTTTYLGCIAKNGLIGAGVFLHNGSYSEITPDCADHIGSFLPFI